MGNQDYINFEHKHKRWTAAKALIDGLSTEMTGGRDPWDGTWNPTDGELENLIENWVPPEIVVCQAMDETGNRNGCPGPENCGRRCTADYWLGHGENVAESMGALAGSLGQDSRMWIVVGRIHDIDYPKYPHHDAAIDSEVAHPVGLASQLRELGAAPAVILAVLSHAPHLRLRPSSPLAWALVACDEHATMMGYALDDIARSPVYRPDLSPLASVLKPASSSIEGGFSRRDMCDRANLGLFKLKEFQDGKIGKFDSAGFSDRIDWEKEAKQMPPAP